MKHTKVVAISGGVDSMTAAFLLKEQGHHVIGIHFITGFETDTYHPAKKKEDTPHRMDKIGQQLGIPIKLLDCSHTFKQRVVDYFTQTYLAGQTPNPCMVCNPTIKFGPLLSFARQLGANLLATGHYARIKKDKKGHFHLFKGIDTQKDQSYFLARLNQSHLAKACFPLGHMKKSDVKQLAQEKGLNPVTRNESQDVCFIKRNSYGEFISQLTGFKSEPGPIVDRNGNLLGEHKGLHLFTIGQRRGINCPAAEPYYVLQIDRKHNRLVVGSKTDLLTSACRVVDMNWINQKPTEPIEVFARVRYRHKEVASTLFPVDKNSVEVRFESPQEAVTPGQAAVFYLGQEVLGGGWISP